MNNRTSHLSTSDNNSTFYLLIPFVLECANFYFITVFLLYCFFTVWVVFR